MDFRTDDVPETDMTRATPSNALLEHALLAYRHLANDMDVAGDPELGLATAFTSGCRALHARADADAWLVPPSVVHEVEALVERMATSAGYDAGWWLDAFPNRLLALLERRTGAIESPHTPRRRWIDRVSERHLALGSRVTFVPSMRH